MARLFRSESLVRFLVVYTALLAGWLVANGPDVGGLVRAAYALVWFAPLLVAGWFLVRSAIHAVLGRLPWTRGGASTPAVSDAIADVLFAQIYIAVGLVVWFGSVLFSGASSSSFSIAGTGGRLIFVDGELTAYGMERAIRGMLASYTTAVVMQVLGLAYTATKALNRDRRGDG